MRKTPILAVIACILGIILLGGIAFFLPKYLSEKSGPEESQLFTGFEISTEDLAGKETVPSADSAGAGHETLFTETEFPSETLYGGHTHSEATEEETEYGPISDLVSKTHRIIWTGDSRTLGMRDALGRAEREDDDIFIGKVGEGIRWFLEEGRAQLDDAIEQDPSLPVVLNLGVNDPQDISEYVTAYWDVIRDHPDTPVYILSVNPIDEEFLIEDGLVNEEVFEDINSVNIGRMNVKLKQEFQDRYLDSSSYLKHEGFDTVDGLHFSTETYLAIHDFVVEQIF